MTRFDRVADEAARSAPIEGEGSPRLSAVETAEYAADMAGQLSMMCERAGLLGLSTLFFAANSEARRAQAKLAQAKLDQARGRK